MLLSVFEKLFFLQSLGWGIINSLWQAALLFALYKAITVPGNKVSAVFKYNVAVLLQAASFIWFVSGITQNYFVAAGTATVAVTGWLQVSQQFNQWLQWLSAAYCLVLVIHLFLFIKKINLLVSIRKNVFVKAPASIRIFTDQSALHLGISKKVKVWLSETTAVPSVIGFFKPVILLPAMALNNLTQAQAEAVILHELAHIKRNDYLINLLQSIIEVILFYNPFVKLLGREIRKERENCCDDWVLNYRYNRHDYASALLLLEQHRFASLQLALAATNGKKALLSRIKRLFDEEPEVNISVTQKIKMALAAVSILMLSLLALPVAGTKTKKNVPVPGAYPALLASATTPGYSENKKLSIIIDEKPASVIRKIKKAPVKQAVQPVSGEDIELNTALINEELLNGDIPAKEPVAIAAANWETPRSHKIYVQVEEEQSGVKDKKTYIVELNNDNGNTSMKPLLLLDKRTRPVGAKSKTLRLKKSPGNKRTTS